MLTTIILSLSILMILLGLSKNVLHDFRIAPWLAISYLAIVIGTSFIPSINLGFINFNIGVAVFFLVAVFFHFFFGKAKTHVLALLITLLLTGILYAGVSFSMLLGNAFFSELNIVYGILIGILALVLTKNAKYAYITAIVPFFFASLLLSINNGVANINQGFDAAVVASTLAVVLYALSFKVMRKPSKMSYYYEIGKLED